MFKYLVLVVSLGLSLQSCAPTHSVEIDSISKPQACMKNTYVLMPANEQCDQNDLIFCEFSTYADRALMQSGFIKANCPENADVTILLNYEVGEPYSYQYTYSVPIYGQTGVNVTTTNSYGCYNSYSTTNCTPTYGIVGSETHVGTKIAFPHYLWLLGYDRRGMECNKSPMWETKARCAFSTGDLRFMFPIMLAATQPYIAKSTGQMIVVEISEDAEKISAIKGIEYASWRRLRALPGDASFSK